MDPRVTEKSAKRAKREIEFILKQLLRFAEMPRHERRAHLQRHPNEAFFRIPRPDGSGHLHCGALAWDKLGTLADLALKIDPDLSLRISHQRARDAVTDAFVKYALQEDSEVNQETGALLLQYTLENLQQSLITTEHYFPCLFFRDGTPCEFSIGPVTFTRRRKFFKDRKQAFERSLEEETATHIEHVNLHIAKGFPRERAHSEIESRQHIRDLQAGAIKNYRGHPWIASVKVKNCEKNTSRERAKRAVEMALHVIRVILGAKPTREIRLAFSRADTMRTAHLYADDQGVIHASLNMRFSTLTGTKNWHEALMRSASDLEFFGSALKVKVDPAGNRHLHQRMLDAIHWFGDAATDPNASSSIIKYVSAIERLLFGSFGRNRTKFFASRVKSILEAFGCNADNRTYEQTFKLYEIRSQLVHGDLFLTKYEENENVTFAENKSRMCILCSAQLYPMIFRAFENPNSATLDEVMTRIGTDGVDWLAEKAGFTKNSSNL